MADLDQILTQFCSEMRKLLAAEYQRGEQDAIARIMKAAQGAPVSTANGSMPSNVSQRQSKPEPQKERAPAGSAEALIDRVLAERGARGATSSEIMAAAKTDIEKLVSYSGIRFRLDQGREQNRYRNRDGKWYRVVSRARVEIGELPEDDSR